MERFSPKIEIINHFDELIQRVDIDIDQSLEKYNENQVLGKLECFKKRFGFYSSFVIDFFESCESSNEKEDQIVFKSFQSSDDNNKEQTVGQWSESTKVVDYLNQVRMKTIEELRKEQKEGVENSSRFNSLINADLTNEEKRSELFAEKFYFQVNIPRPRLESWVFNLFTFVTDFYLSQSDIDLLQKIINFYVTNDTFSNQEHVFDEKMVLIGLLDKQLRENLKHKKFPNHVIHVFKQDVSKISDIDFKYKISAVKLNGSSIALSKLKHLFIKNTNAKLDYIILDSLSSLDYLSFHFYSVKEISFKNLYALKQVNLYLHSNETINMQTNLFEHLPNIQTFIYTNCFMRIAFKKLEKHINVDSICFIKDLNFDYFINHFSKQIEKLKIMYLNSENQTKLLSEYDYPNLLELEIRNCKITRIEKKLFDGLSPMIQTLKINCDSLEIIDNDAFSNMKQLVFLDLSNNSIESLDRRIFSGLNNLQVLCLYKNRINRIDGNVFSELKKLTALNLSDNQLEILDAKSFVGLENLNSLYLSNNKLGHFDVGILVNLPRIDWIHLSGNDISNIGEILRLRSANEAFKDLFCFKDLSYLKDLFRLY